MVMLEGLVVLIVSIFGILKVYDVGLSYGGRGVVIFSLVLPLFDWLLLGEDVGPFVAILLGMYAYILWDAGMSVCDDERRIN